MSNANRQPPDTSDDEMNVPLARSHLDILATQRDALEGRYTRVRSRLVVALLRFTKDHQASGDAKVTTVSFEGSVEDDAVLIILPPTSVKDDEAWRLWDKRPIVLTVAKFIINKKHREFIEKIWILIKKAEKAGKRAREVQKEIDGILDKGWPQESMKLNTFNTLHESVIDPFNDPNDTPLSQYKALSHTAEGVKHRLERNNAKFMNLLTISMDKGWSDIVGKSRLIKDGLAKEDDFEYVHVDIGRYMLKSHPIGAKLIKLAARIKKDEDYIRSMPVRKTKAARPAALDYIKQRQKTPGSVIQPSELHENIRVYSKEEEKFKWLHNPSKFGDDPKYAGSPHHYDWKGAMATTYFLLSDWLEENGTPFQKLFASMDEGKPWVVAVAANHAFVLQIHEGRGIVYVRGQEPIAANKFLNQPYGVMAAVKNTLQVSAEDLDEVGKVKPKA